MKSQIATLIFLVGFCVTNCRCKSDEPEITENPIQDPKYWSEIQPGTFILGSPPTEPCRAAVAEDQVEVTLTNLFIMKKTEVTQGEWEAVGFPNPEPRKDPDLPFASANWFEALAFCNRISELEGLETCYDLSNCEGKVGGGCPGFIEENGDWLCSEGGEKDPGNVYVCRGNVRKFESNPYLCPGYRLPTRAEWEYAARAGTTTATYNGDTATSIDDECLPDSVVEPIAWYCGNSNYQSQLVGQKQPNDWNLYDMLGNVKEWTDDVHTAWDLAYNEIRAGWNPENTENHLIDPVGAPYEVDMRRLAYGSSYVNDGCKIRAAKTAGYSFDIRMSFIGFRPVKTIQSTSDPDSGIGLDGGS